MYELITYGQSITTALDWFRMPTARRNMDGIDDATALLVDYGDIVGEDEWVERCALHHDCNGMFSFCDIAGRPASGWQACTTHVDCMGNWDSCLARMFVGR
jgi:hypothetical protein